MSKQKLKQRIEEIFLELNLQDLPLTTTYESSVGQFKDSTQTGTPQSAITGISPTETHEIKPEVGTSTLIEINKTIDLVPYILNSFSQINGLSNLLIQGIDGALSDQQLSDVIAIRKISESQSFLLKEIEELSRHAINSEIRKKTAFSVQDLLTQIQTVFLKGEYRGLVSLDIFCPPEIPNLFTDAVYLRRSIIHSLELLVLHEKEITIDSVHLNQDNNQAIHFHIHRQKTEASAREKKPSSATQRSIRLHCFFIEHWINQIGGRVSYDQDSHNTISGIHIHIPVLEDPNMLVEQKSDIENPLLLCVSLTIPSVIMEAARQSGLDFKQIKKKNDLVERKQQSAHSCLINYADYQSNWQVINDCLFDISASAAPVIPFFHTENATLSTWFPEARIMINPVEPNELIHCIQKMVSQHQTRKIWILDIKQYVERLLKSLQSQFEIEPCPESGIMVENSTDSPIVIVNLQLNLEDESFVETTCIQNCLTKKIPVILLFPENINQNQADHIYKTFESIVHKMDILKMEKLMNFLK